MLLLLLLLTLWSRDAVIFHVRHSLRKRGYYSLRSSISRNNSIIISSSNSLCQRLWNGDKSFAQIRRRRRTLASHIDKEAYNETPETDSIQMLDYIILHESAHAEGEYQDQRPKAKGQEIRPWKMQ